VIEFDAICDRLAAEAETPMGQDACRNTTPSYQPDVVRHLLNLTGEAYDLLPTGLPSLRGVKDVRSPLRVAEKGGVLDGQILAAVGQALTVCRTALHSLEVRKDLAPDLFRIAQNLPRLDRLESLLSQSLDGDGTVRDSASQELVSLRQRKASASKKVLERIQSYVSGRTRVLLSDPIYTERDGRFVIPLKAENRGKIRGIVHDTSASGQTIYLEPADVIQLGNQVREIEAAERAEVERILRMLSESVGEKGTEIGLGIDIVGRLDEVFARVRLGTQMNGVIPRILDGPQIEIRDGRHPLLDPKIAVPLSLSLGADCDGLLITGPNTGGKTISIKTVGLFVAMGQAGMMLPAKDVGLGCFTQIWADIGDEQSLQQSLSTFSGHIKNIAAALEGLRPGALVLLDEVGAGTDPAEGASLAQALLLEFQSRGAKIMASTHYGELKLFATDTAGFVNASMEFDVKSLRPTYRLLVGTPGSSHALKIAERYGIPTSVVERAESGLGTQERDLSKVIEKLENSQRQAQKAQSEADRLTHRLKSVEREAEAKIQAADEAKSKLQARAADEISELLRVIRLEAADIFETLKRRPDQAGMDQARARLKKLQEVGQDFVNEMRPVVPPAKREAARVSKGTQVRLLGVGMTGTVLEDPKGKAVPVQVGSMKMTVNLDQMEVVAEAPRPQPGSRSGTVQVAKAQSAVREIQLIQMRAEAAQEALDKFLDDALLAGLPSVRIVHGKGEGILRDVTRRTLQNHPGVTSFRDGEAGEGGQGATIAELE